MDRQDVVHAIGALSLPRASFVVVGGASMAMRGIRNTSDIDLVVTPELFDTLVIAGWHTKLRPNGKPGLRQGNVEAYIDVNTDAFERSTTWLLQHAEIIQDVPCVDVHTLLCWKRAYGREKDRADVALLEPLCAGRAAAIELPGKSLGRSGDP